MKRELQRNCWKTQGTKGKMREKYILDWSKTQGNKNSWTNQGVSKYIILSKKTIKIKVN